MTKLEIRNLCKTRGASRVLRDVSLSVEPGSFCVIVGPSGCGKSTLLRLIAGLDTVDSGAILFDGQPVDGLAAQARNIGLVFQNYALYPHMNVRENLAYGLRIRGCPGNEIARRIAQTSGMLQLNKLLERRPDQLSGGEQQRVAIGRAIIREPRLLLLDEPLSNLDAKLRTEMRLEIRDLHRRTGATTLFVTHDQSDAMTLADHLVVMENGAIAQAGPPRALYDKPASIFVASFLGDPPMNMLAVQCDVQGRAFLGDGQALNFSLPDVPSAIRLGIRPEHVRVGAAGLPADVMAVEDFGHRCIVHASVGGQSLRFAAPQGTQLRSGDRIAVAWDMAHCHMFEAESGRRLVAKIGGGALRDTEMPFMPS